MARKNETVQDQAASIEDEADPLKETIKSVNPGDSIPETYERPNSLRIPDAVKEKYKAEGYGLRWVRVYIDNGKIDANRIRAAMTEGFRFLTKDEVPDMAVDLNSLFSSEIDKHGDLILRGDLALAKIPQKILDQKKEFVEGAARNQMSAEIQKIRQGKLGGVLKSEGIGESARSVSFKED